MNRVKADLQCPFCGHCKVVKIGAHRKAITCPSCKQAVFLKLALFKRAEEMSQFDFRETTNEEWSGIVADIIKKMRRGKM